MVGNAPDRACKLVSSRCAMKSGESEGFTMLEVRKTIVYRGPNVWARMPVILFTLYIGELEDRPTNKITGFYERLTELLPSLYDHGCSLGRPGGFLQRLR